MLVGTPPAAPTPAPGYAAHTAAGAAAPAGHQHLVLLAGAAQVHQASVQLEAAALRWGAGRGLHTLQLWLATQVGRPGWHLATAVKHTAQHQ